MGNRMDNGSEASLPFANSIFADLHGVRLHGRTWLETTTARSGQVLLVHGLGASTYCWERVAEPLAAAGFFVVAVDLPAFGYSSRQRGLDHSQPARSRLLWTMLDQLGCAGQQWILVGHSMGAGTVAAMTIAQPGRVAKLVWVAPALHYRPIAGMALLMRLPGVRHWVSARLSDYLASSRRLYRSLYTACGQAPQPGQLNAYQQPLALPGTAAALTDMTVTSGRLPWNQVRQIRLPVQVIWGTRDQVVPLWQFGRLHRYLPTLRLYRIEQAGHLPMETHPDAFNAILLQILREA